LKVAELESEGAKADAMAAVGLLYMEALKAHASVQMHETNQQLLSDLLAFSRRRQAGGMATGLDTARLESQLENEKQRGSIARYDFERAKLSLTNAMGLPIDTPLQLTDEFHTRHRHLAFGRRSDRARHLPAPGGAGPISTNKSDRPGPECGVGRTDSLDRHARGLWVDWEPGPKHAGDL